MCGIFGIVNVNNTSFIQSETLCQMGDIIKHRGPDDAGFFIERNVGLGMRRLSIIDLSGGHQPIFNERETLCTVFNGEIYNYLELRKDLQERGHHFQTSSDTEVIVHAYEEWGDDCPKKLRGMFAFAIWDKEKERLFIARDRIGKKPLYYYQDGQKLIFGSEIKSILQAEKIPCKLNAQILDTFLTLGYVPAPYTMFNGIFKLPAGHTLTLDNGNCRISQYWDLEYKTGSAVTLADYREQLRHLLEESVRLRLMSDVPLGAFLSGGIDSSIIVGLMSRMMNQPVDTFSVGFEESELNELPFARIAAQAFETRHHEIFVNTCSPELIEQIVWHLDEPVADPAAVPTYLVSKLARQTVKVVLTGEGGDELFAGYDYYKVDRWARRYQVLPTQLRQKALPALAKSVNTLLGRDRYHDRTIWYWGLPPESQMAAWVAIFTDAEKEKLYSHELRRQLQQDQKNGAGAVFSRFYQRHAEQDNLHRMLYIDAKVWLPDDLLMKVDKTSMANSIEARTPFLDHHLFEFVATIPPDLKLNGSISKFILKEVAKEILPEKIINRPKQSFDVPIGKWLKGSLRELTYQLISDGLIVGEKLFDEEYILGEMWTGLEKDYPGYARQFWSLLHLGLWARRFQAQLD